MLEMKNDGFMFNSTWNRKKAEKNARQEGIKLTEKHWDVINYIHEYYSDFKALPSVYKICAKTSLTTLEICKLFPKDGIRSAFRIAGVPLTKLQNK